MGASIYCKKRKRSLSGEVTKPVEYVEVNSIIHAISTGTSATLSVRLRNGQLPEVPK